MLRSACSIVALLLSAIPAFSDAARGEDTTLAQPCQTLPDGGRELDKNPGESPSETLRRCRGVLEPPDIGDDIAEPAPDVGETPVIRPGELPRHQIPQ